MDGDDAAPVPRYVQIADEIRRAVGAGTYLPGCRLSSEDALARTYGVSRGALRQALARPGVVRTIPGHGTIVQGVLPPTEPTDAGDGRVVGIVIPAVARTRIPDLVDGAESEPRRANYSLVLASSGDDPLEEVRQIRRLVQAGMAGLIVYPVDGSSNVPLLRDLAAGGPALALIDRYLLELPADAVVVDNIGGAYTAVSRLLATGRQRIGFVSTHNLGTSSVAERQAGYSWALQRHGRPIDPNLTCTGLERLFAGPVPDSMDAEHNRHLLRGYLSASHRPDAIFAVNDAVAFHVLEAARQLALRVPADLGVVGFDNLASPDYGGVPLTTVDQPRYQIGATAARIVQERIQGGAARRERVVLSTRLIVRGTCGGDGVHIPERSIRLPNRRLTTSLHRQSELQRLTKRVSGWRRPRMAASREGS